MSEGERRFTDVIRDKRIWILSVCVVAVITVVRALLPGWPGIVVTIVLPVVAAALSDVTRS